MRDCRRGSEAMKTMSWRTLRTTAPFALLATVATLLGPMSDARAEGTDLAAKCRESGDHGACAAAGAPLEASSPESTLELYSVSCTKRPDQCWALLSYAQRSLKKKDG